MTVSLVGPPGAVILLARTLATVTTVAAMRHTPTDNAVSAGTTPAIRLDITCLIGGRHS